MKANNTEVVETMSVFQHEESHEMNALVVDLYKENADLMDSLYNVSQQKKDAITKCYKLEEQCVFLRKMLKELAKTVVS